MDRVSILVWRNEFFCCKFRNSGKFGHYLVDSVLKMEKVKFVMSTIDVGRNNETKLLIIR